MDVLIPVNHERIDEAQLVDVNDATHWVCITLNDNSQVVSHEVYTQPNEALQKGVDYAVVAHIKEDQIAFFSEYDIQLLCATPFDSIDDIVEAFVFKTLLEV